jgi:hypothetical protein
MISDAGGGGDGQRVGVRVLADFVIAQAQPEEQTLGTAEQPARFDFVF